VAALKILPAAKAPPEKLPLTGHSRIKYVIGNQYWIPLLETISMAENIQAQVLKILQTSRSGLQMEEVGEKLGLTRHTVAKYLEVLRAEGKIHYSKIGRTKLWKDLSTAITTQLLGTEDLEDILRIA
jgi:biotin operon repressor